MIVLNLGDSRTKTVRPHSDPPGAGAELCNQVYLILLTHAQTRMDLSYENVRQMPTEEPGSNPIFYILWKTKAQPGFLAILEIFLVIPSGSWPLLLGLSSTLFQPKWEMESLSEFSPKTFT